MVAGTKGKKELLVPAAQCIINDCLGQIYVIKKREVTGIRSHNMQGKNINGIQDLDSQRRFYKLNFVTMVIVIESVMDCLILMSSNKQFE